MEISLSAHILRKTGLEEAEIADLASFVEIREVSRRSCLVLPDNASDALVFVERGILRQYTVDTVRREHSLQFGVEGCWLGNWTKSAIGGSTSVHLQAVEDSRVAVLEPTGLTRLLERIPRLERYFLNIHRRAHAAALQRIHLLTSTDGIERYHRFQHRYRNFVQRVPQYMLASFLGFTPEWLSKIRSGR